MEKVRVGIIGLAFVSNLHAEAFQSVAIVEFENGAIAVIEDNWARHGGVD
ncbi:MAG TPA: hypothetical protein VMW54_10445 [Terriglobia bacterium]|nr:hypothetical protein [Terriglobia bacterium]